jgi:hypothetical protein
MFTNIEYVVQNYIERFEKNKTYVMFGMQE